MAEGIVPDVNLGAGRSWQALMQDALPSLAASAGTPRFPACLVEVLRHVVAFDWWMVMIYRDQANP